MILVCTIHGEAPSKRVQCELMKMARDAWRARTRSRPNEKDLIITAVLDKDINHAAACSGDPRAPELLPERMRSIWRAVKSSQRSARVKETWAAKRRGREMVNKAIAERDAREAASRKKR